MSLRQPITRAPSTPHGLPAYALRLALYDLYASCYWALVELRLVKDDREGGKGIPPRRLLYPTETRLLVNVISTYKRQFIVALW
ncbi:hypothetical protein TNIN_109171 [Trichonephila inaurata madagascariensis]|uniref:Uncharacterized protein n=1 Tax=Trichonephila inaurata madagascariensis TaxID=2747483 RepID=A0A8X6YEN2_9ARAC|nr:hypothetical protein TNIN_109171 [Trichonephila inaurata madagascariensis]